MQVHLLLEKYISQERVLEIFNSHDLAKQTAEQMNNNDTNHFSGIRYTYSVKTMNVNNNVVNYEKSN